MGRKRRGRVLAALALVAAAAVCARGWYAGSTDGIDSVDTEPSGNVGSLTREFNTLGDEKVPTEEKFGTPKETHGDLERDELRPSRAEDVASSRTKTVTPTNNPVTPNPEPGIHGAPLRESDESEIGEKKDASKKTQHSKNIVHAVDEAGRAARFGFPKNAALSATFATIDVVDMLHNWHNHAVGAGLPNIVVIALDEKIVQWCVGKNIRVLDASALIDVDTLTKPTDDKSVFIGHRERKHVFNKIGIVKTTALLALLNAGLDVLISDVDVVWLNSPAKYFKSGQAKNAKVLVSSDCVFGFEPGRAAFDKFGQAPDPRNAEFNTGVLLLRRGRQSVDLVNRWLGSQVEFADQVDMNDQSHFNKVIHEGGGGREAVDFYPNDVVGDDDVVDALKESSSRDDQVVTDDDESSDDSLDVTLRKKEPGIDPLRTPDAQLFPDEYKKGLRPRLYVCGANKTFVALLPTGLFSNGHTFFVSHVGERSGVAPFAVHNTYQYSGTAGKIARFRENGGMWTMDGGRYFGEDTDDNDDKSISNVGVDKSLSNVVDGKNIPVHYKGSGLGDTENRATPNEAGSNPKKFLYLRYDIPGHLADPMNSLKTPKGNTPFTHLGLITYQVNRIRDGLLLATELNRTLILPPLLCTCDRWFNLLPNCTQGDLRVPFLCPTDHVFLIGPLDTFDGGGRYAERAFFANRETFLAKRLGVFGNSSGGIQAGITENSGDSVDVNGVASAHAAGKQSSAVPALGPVAKLVFDGPGSSTKKSSDSSGGGVADTNKKQPFAIPGDTASLPGFSGVDSATSNAIASVKTGSPRYVRVKFGSTVGDIKRNIQFAADAKLLIVDNLAPNALAGFGDDKKNERFHEKLLPIIHEWCCRKNGTVGHLPTKFGVWETVGAGGVSTDSEYAGGESRVLG